MLHKDDTVSLQRNNALTIKEKPRKKGLPGKIILSCILLVMGVSMIFPFIFMISSSFKPNADVFGLPIRIIPERIFVENYKYIFRNNEFMVWYLNSIRTVLLLIVFRFFIVTQSAYAFARLKFKFREVIFLMFISTMMIPWDTTILPRYLIYQAMNITDTQWSLIIPGTFDVFFLFLTRQFFLTIPFELTEAAIIDGCSHFKIYLRIMLPLAKPALITMVMFTFIWAWNDYTGPYIFITNMKRQMLTVGLATFQGIAGADYALQMAGACLAIIPVVILFLFSQKYFIKGIATTGLKG